MNTRILCSRQLSGITGLIPFIFLSLLVTGCGNKTLPKPISHGTPPQVGNLQAVVRPKGVEVSWPIPQELKSAPKDSGYHFSILKAELKWENRSCLDCPTPNQQEVQKIDPAFPDPASIQDGKLVWTDTVVSKNHAYRYQVSLVAKRNTIVSTSNPAVAIVEPPPPAPRDLQANTQQQGILLQWKSPSKDSTGQPLQGDLEFMVERQAAGKGWESASPGPVRANAYMDKILASNEVYDYRVTPVLKFENTLIFGEPAVIRQVKSPGAIPPPPPKSVWVVPGKGGLEVHWTESEGKTGGYHVYRREGKEITRLTSTPVEHPPYIDRNTKRNVVYYYAVSAVNAPPNTQQEGLVSKWVEVRNLFE